MMALADAVPPLPSSTVTVTWTGPSCCPAVQRVDRLVALASVPEGAVHRYVRLSPSGSVAVAVSVQLRPTSTVAGSQTACTVGGRLGGASGGGGAAAGG